MFSNKEILLIISILFLSKLHSFAFKLELGSQNHIMRKGFEISKEDIYYNTFVKTQCKCSQLCTADSCCQSYSGKRQGPLRNYLCSLSEKLPKDCKQIESDDESFIAVPIAASDDARVYWMAEGKMTFDAAKKLCNSKPGFRLGIYKTEVQLNMLRKYSNYNMSCIHVDLMDNDNDDAQWGDGTWFQKTELAKLKVFNEDQRDGKHKHMAWDFWSEMPDGILDDSSATRQCMALCFWDPIELF